MEGKDIERFNNIMESLGDTLTYIKPQGKIIRLCTGYLPMNELRIPNGVMEIIKNPAVTLNDRKNISALERVSIPDSCTSIKSAAFGDCLGLRGTIENNKIKAIGPRAFENTNIEKIIVPNLILIQTRAFSNCSKLRHISCSDRLWLEDGAFYGCNAIENVDGRILGSTEEGPFSSARNLKEIRLSRLSPEELQLHIKELENLGAYAEERIVKSFVMYRCRSLKKIDIGNETDVTKLYIKHCAKQSRIEEFIGINLEELDLNEVITIGDVSGSTRIVLGDIKVIKTKHENTFGFEIEFTKDTTVDFVNDANTYTSRVTKEVKAGDIMTEGMVKKALGIKYKE